MLTLIILLYLWYLILLYVKWIVVNLLFSLFSCLCLVLFLSHNSYQVSFLISILTVMVLQRELGVPTGRWVLAVTHKARRPCAVDAGRAVHVRDLQRLLREVQWTARLQGLHTSVFRGPPTGGVSPGQRGVVRLQHPHTRSSILVRTRAPVAGK